VSAPVDPGLQGERTALAWTRTALALALAGAIVTRLTVDRLGVIALALGACAIALAAVMAVIARIRFVRAAASLHKSATLPSDGRLLALASGSMLAIGAAAALFVAWGMLVP
jgi:uncharacterized membrane protein YidH (DUF202 family)